MSLAKKAKTWWQRSRNSEAATPSRFLIISDYRRDIMERDSLVCRLEQDVDRLKAQCADYIQSTASLKSRVAQLQVVVAALEARMSGLQSSVIKIEGPGQLQKFLVELAK